MNSAVRSEPKWRYPVGEGAKRVRAGVSGRLFFDLRSCAPAAEDDALHCTQVHVRRESSRLDIVLIGVAMSVRERNPSEVCRRSTESVLALLSFCGGSAAPLEVADKILGWASA